MQNKPYFFSSHKHVIPKYLRRTPQSKVMADIPFLGNRPLYFTLYKVEGCVTTLRSKVSAKLKKKGWFLGNLSTKNCGLNAKFENCIFKDNPSDLTMYPSISTTARGGKLGRLRSSTPSPGQCSWTWTRGTWAEVARKHTTLKNGKKWPEKVCGGGSNRYLGNAQM